MSATGRTPVDLPGGWMIVDCWGPNLSGGAKPTFCNDPPAIFTGHSAQENMEMPQRRSSALGAALLATTLSFCPEHGVARCTDLTMLP